MPDSHSQPPTTEPLRFTESEIDLLGRTADAMSAWMGKPVLAQIVDAIETGFEWVLFAVPLLPEQDATDLTIVQVGGPGARIIGNKGGLPMTDSDLYDCEYLWAVQLSDLQGIRYIKVDGTGEEIAWTHDLNEIVPFDLSEAYPRDAEFPDDEHDDTDPDDGFFFDSGDGDKPTIH